MSEEAMEEQESPYNKLGNEETAGISDGLQRIETVDDDKSDTIAAESEENADEVVEVTEKPSARTAAAAPAEGKSFVWLRLLMVALVTSTVCVIIYFYSTAFIRDNPSIISFEPKKEFIIIDQVIRNPGKVAFKDKESMLILVVGLDESRDASGIAHTKGSRTDTIFVVRVDKKAERLGMLSIPRDTWVLISEERGYGKINSAFPIAFLDVYDRTGDYDQALMAGLLQVRKTVQDFLNVSIDHIVLLKIDACKQVVDAIGGVTVDVEKDMHYNDYWGNLHIDLKKGPQRLNGEQAVGYARFRNDEEGDWGRMRRQQQVIKALVNEMKKPANILRVNKLASIVKSNLETDFSVLELIDLAHVYKNFNQNNIARGIIKGDDDWAGGGMIVVPYEQEKKSLVRRVLMSPGEILPEDLRIRVVNGTLVDDAGWHMARHLENQGFIVTGVVDEPDRKKYPTTTIIFNEHQDYSGAMMIEKVINCRAAVQYESSDEKNQDYEFIVVVGDSFLHSDSYTPGAVVKPTPEKVPAFGEETDKQDYNPTLMTPSPVTMPTDLMHPETDDLMTPDIITPEPLVPQEPIDTKELEGMGIKLIIPRDPKKETKPTTDPGDELDVKFIR
jgi:polyisoprenyl-teichoic acid--peptidoglycan teichoic acid transferase